MNCKFCKHTGTDEEYRNEPIISSESIHVSLLFEGELAVWLPSKDGCLCIQAIIPVSHCPMCGRKL